MESQQFSFTAHFVRINSLESTFAQWHFEEGMGFSSRQKWWQTDDNSDRPTRHEGVDFCCFLDKTNELVWLSEKETIPAIGKGVVAEIFDDFVEKSVLVRHDVYAKGQQLCSLYAHIAPKGHVQPGNVVEPGTCIGHCAEGKSVPTHLHVSLLWLPISEKAVNWSALSKKPGSFIDPFLTCDI